MLHAPAREAIGRILTGDGFADRALALSLAGSLAELGIIPESLAQRVVARAVAMAPDRGVLPPPSETALPNDEAELVDQFAPMLTELGGSAGRHAASLHALTTFWPHVGGPERAGMRRRFLAGATSLSTPVGGEVTPAELRAWQRDLPTSGNAAPPNLASVGLLLDERDPRKAYHVLAEHLGATLDPATLSWVLGGLAVQELLRRRDRHGGLLNCLLGTMALERLAPRVAAEHVATMISQIAMQLWWWRHHGNLSPIRSCLDGVARPLGDAVRSGDITAAQRAARAASGDSQALWREFGQLLEESLAWNDRHLLRALSAIVALAWRSGDAMSPDDAAATATVLADLSYHERQASAPQPA